LRARRRHRCSAADGPQGRDDRRDRDHRGAARQHDPARRPHRRARRGTHRWERRARRPHAYQRRVPGNRRIAARSGRGMMMMGRPQGRGPDGRPQAGQRGGPFMGLSAPVERSKDFRGTLRKLLAWAQAYIMAGVAQRTVYGMRREVEEKLARLPLRYFDSHAHGDLLSRVTNDVDNIATTLQQGLSQLLTSVLTVIGVLGMMLWISPLLALISVITIPLSFAVTILIAGRSQKEFIAQWAETGALNGH